jgi:hypothetical protein
VYRPRASYKYIARTGALNEGWTAAGGRAAVELVPAPVARDNLVMPVAFDGETATFAAVNADGIGLADKLRFTLNENVRLLASPRAAIAAAIERYYGDARSADCMLPV